MDQQGKSVSLGRKMSNVGLLAAMKTFTKPHFQRKKKRTEGGGVKQQSRSWDSGLCHLGLSSQTVSQPPLGTTGSYKKIYWTGYMNCVIVALLLGALPAPSHNGQVY